MSASFWRWTTTGSPGTAGIPPPSGNTSSAQRARSSSSSKSIRELPKPARPRASWRDKNSNVALGDRDGRLHRRPRRESLVPPRELGSLAAPVVVGEAEVEPAEDASRGDAADRRLALEVGGAPLEEIEPLAPLAPLALDPIAPVQLLRPEHHLVAAQDARIEDAVAR